MEYSERNENTFLTDNFPPEVNAPASRTFDHCKAWVKAGADVTLVTCVPNFPQGVVYSGYRNTLYQKEVMEGVKVIRVWSYIVPNKGIAKRTLDYIAIPSLLSLPGCLSKQMWLWPHHRSFLRHFPGGHWLGGNASRGLWKCVICGLKVSRRWMPCGIVGLSAILNGKR